MKRVKISASTSYEVLVGSDLIPQTGRYVAQMNASSTAAVISDSNVWPIYVRVYMNTVLTPYILCFLLAKAVKMQVLI